MGCDYFGTKDGGKITIEYTVYNESGDHKYSKSITLEVDNNDEIYVDETGDVRDR